MHDHDVCLCERKNSRLSNTAAGSRLRSTATFHDTRRDAVQSMSHAVLEGIHQAKERLEGNM